jgi:hypothetical protein
LRAVLHRFERLEWVWIGDKPFDCKPRSKRLKNGPFLGPLAAGLIGAMWGTLLISALLREFFASCGQATKNPLKSGVLTKR